MAYRTEHDSMGEIRVPVDARYGAQTQRAVENFQFSQRRMPLNFIYRLALIKASAARANQQLGLISEQVANAIVRACESVVAGEQDDQFPVDVFQTGSGTSTNMNMNEVLASLASESLGEPVHPNDIVNMSQSSNDVIPSAIHVSASLDIELDLIPATERLQAAITAKGKELGNIVKTGRTHLMDAMPLTFGQELSGWAWQVEETRDRLGDLLKRLRALPLGGTAIGTGVNCDPAFPGLAVSTLNEMCDAQFSISKNSFSRMAGQENAVECASCLKALAVTLMKVSNDLRWMSSGPLAGLGEIELKPLQPGSSIMPGKVNPVIPEAVTMVCAEIIGNDATVTVGAQSGNFQLNVMLPIIAEKLLSGIMLLARASDAIADTITGFSVNKSRINEILDRNPILVTGLNTRIGYEKAAVIAKRAYAEGRPVIDVALEETDLSEADLKGLMDPAKLAHPGQQSDEPDN
ncbi:MAG: class II fumarate hydratase [Pseudomonadales bacterium]